MKLPLAVAMTTAALAALATPVRAGAQPAAPPACVAAVQAALDQEAKDRALLLPIIAEARVRGAPAVNAHLDELVAMVDRAPGADLPDCDGRRYERGAGPAQALLSLAESAKAHQAVKLVMLPPSPYVIAALYAGSAYVSRGRWAEADRVMSRGRAIAPANAGLASEDALALSHLGRNDEAKAICDRALAGAALSPPEDRARLLRTHGYVLGEMGRYDEAIADYQQSLTLTPGNGLALNEIAYLSKRKAGGAQVAPSTLLSKDSQAVKPPQ